MFWQPLLKIQICAFGLQNRLNKATALTTWNDFSWLQVLISHAENKDGSGGPLDYEDLKDLVFPRERVELERTLMEPTEHQSIIVVRQRIHIHIHIALWQVKTTDHLHLCVNHAELEETFPSPLVPVKTHLAFAISLSFHDVCFLNSTQYFPFRSSSIVFPLLIYFPLSHPFLVSHALFSFILYLWCSFPILWSIIMWSNTNTHSHRVRLLSGGIWCQIHADICVGFVLFSSLVQLHIQKEPGNLRNTSQDCARTRDTTGQKHDI